MNDDLSKKLDEAREKETYYRGLLLFWKRRRQKLEAQIPDHIWNEAWNDDDESIGS